MNAFRIILSTLVTLSVWTSLRAEALPAYDTGIIRDYKAHPSNYENDHDRAFRVVEAYSIKFYDEMMTHYMAEMHLTQPPVPVETLNGFLTYYKSMPLPVLVLNAQFEPAKSLDYIILAGVIKYQLQHRLPMTVGFPPMFDVPAMMALGTKMGALQSFAPTDKKIKQVIESTPEPVAPPTPAPVSVTEAAHNPADAGRITKLEDTLAMMEADRATSKQHEKLLFIALGIVIVIMVASRFMGGNGLMK